MVRVSTHRRFVPKTILHKNVRLFLPPQPKQQSNVYIQRAKLRAFRLNAARHRNKSTAKHTHPSPYNRNKVRRPTIDILLFEYYSMTMPSGETAAQRRQESCSRGRGSAFSHPLSPRTHAHAPYCPTNRTISAPSAYLFLEPEAIPFFTPASTKQSHWACSFYGLKLRSVDSRVFTPPQISLLSFFFSSTQQGAPHCLQQKILTRREIHIFEIEITFIIDPIPL